MKNYLEIINKVFEYGESKIGRNGETISISGAEFRHDMRIGFPILTVREMNLGMAITELRFFIQGLTDKSWLQKRGNKFWDKWCNKNNLDYAILEIEFGPSTAARMVTDLGPIYGSQWRNFNGQMIEGEWGHKGPDQLKEVIETLNTNPMSRRMLVSAWNPIDIEYMALPPCHDSFQLISNGKELDLIWRQRSCDIAIGLPYDILLYGLLLTLIAKEVKMTPRYLIGQLGDTHYYKVNEKKLNIIRQRDPKILPELIFNHKASIFDWAESDELSVMWKLFPYAPHSKLFFEVVK